MANTRKLVDTMGRMTGEADSRDKLGPSFSIVMPTFQRRDVVVDAVKALSSLEYSGPLEVIIVVDGSIDGTAVALRQLKSRFPIKIIEQSNHGAAHARNRGATEATGDVILFLDDDMICDPDLVEQHAQVYREGADAVIGSTPTHPDSARGFLSESVRRWIENEQVRSPVSHWDVFSGQLSVRKSVFYELGGFDEHYTSGPAFSNEDADLGVRLLARFDVRHNPSAISRQRYVVGPSEYMNRAGKAAEGDRHFLSKHPQLSREVFAARGRDSRLARCVYIPLSGIPLVPKILSAVSTWAAETALRTPFRSNRMLARCFSGSRSVAYWAKWRTRWQLPGTERLLVLCYHAIRDQSEDSVLAPYGVPADLFAEHLDLLSADGFSFVTPNALANFLTYDAPLPRRSVLLTFDDGYDDLIDIARNVLHPRKIEAIAFAVTAIESGTNEWDQAYGAAPVKLLTSEQLRELARVGVEIGSHSRSHRDMTLLDRSECDNEARGSADDLAAAGLPRPRFFAYPFGAVDKETRTAVQEAGYLAAFGCNTDLVSAASDPLILPRVGVFACDRGWRFRLKVRAPRLLADFGELRRRLNSRVRKIGRSARGER